MHIQETTQTLGADPAFTIVIWYLQEVKLLFLQTIHVPSGLQSFLSLIPVMFTLN
jgi:hypothetical protein